MLFKQLLLAGLAAAFLVVPQISEPEDGIYRTLPIDIEAEHEKVAIPATANTQSIEVPCPQCRGQDARLNLNFAIEESTRLVLNGFELYPNPDPWQGDLTAAVVRANGKGEDRRLGYGLSVRPEGTDEGQNIEVIALDLHIIEVGDRFLDDIPSVKVKLIKFLSGNVLIGSIDMNGSHQEQVESEECGTMWCHVQGVFDKAWNGVKSKFHGKGCKGMKSHGHSSPHGYQQNQEEDKNAFHQHGEDGHRHHGKFGKFGKSGHKHHHHHEHSWSVLKHVVSYVFLPVVMGITAGVGVAVLAMFLGTLLMRIVRLARGDRPETMVYVDRKMDIIEFLAADQEKAGLMEHQDAPPQYEDEPSRN